MDWVQERGVHWCGFCKGWEQELYDRARAPAQQYPQQQLPPTQYTPQQQYPSQQPEADLGYDTEPDPDFDPDESEYNPSGFSTYSEEDKKYGSAPKRQDTGKPPPPRRPPPKRDEGHNHSAPSVDVNEYHRMLASGAPKEDHSSIGGMSSSGVKGDIRGVSPFWSTRFDKWFVIALCGGFFTFFGILAIPEDPLVGLMITLICGSGVAFSYLYRDEVWFDTQKRTIVRRSTLNGTILGTKEIPLSKLGKFYLFTLNGNTSIRAKPAEKKAIDLFIRRDPTLLTNLGYKEMDLVMQDFLTQIMKFR